MGTEYEGKNAMGYRIFSLEGEPAVATVGA
jgi:hypothetical protein